MYRSKRPHAKSRAGCQGCKRRKIKCDEVHPTCSFCDERNFRCIYISSNIEFPAIASSSGQTSGSTPDLNAPAQRSRDLALHTVFQELPPQIPRQVNIINEKNAMPLRMMDLWIISTHDSLSFESAKSIWRVEITRLALEHDYLMHSILAVTGHHLQDLLPDQSNIQYKTAVYQTKAIQGFRTAMSDISQSNFQALLVTSLLIVILGMKQHDIGLEGELSVSHWLGLGIGTQSLFKIVGWRNISESPISSVFDFCRNFETDYITPIVPPGLQQMMCNIETTDADWPYLEDLDHAMGLLGRLYGHLNQMHLPVSPPNFEALNLEVWSWATRITPRFYLLVKELRPRALIILGHFLPFLQIITGSWWTRGIGKKDIPAIIKAVAPEWRPLLEVPHLAVEAKDLNTAVRLLLTQLR